MWGKASRRKLVRRRTEADVLPLALPGGRLRIVPHLVGQARIEQHGSNADTKILNPLGDRRLVGRQSATADRCGIFGSRLRRTPPGGTGEVQVGLFGQCERQAIRTDEGLPSERCPVPPMAEVLDAHHDGLLVLTDESPAEMEHSGGLCGWEPHGGYQ